MHSLSISTTTFKRLERHAKAFVDTPDTVINRALAALDRLAGVPAPNNGYSTASERRIDPQQLPDLTHAKILDATVAGTAVPRPNWNLLLKKMVRLAIKRVGTLDELCRLCPINAVSGQKEDEGYSYLPDIDVSVQGQASNAACQAVVAIAQSFDIALDIGFLWRNKQGAAYPGERGRIRIPGANSA